MNYESSSEFENNESMTPSHSEANASSQRKSPRRAGTAANTDSAFEKRSQCQCSYCGAKFFREESNYMPFCSNRCKQIDLGMWLNESYRLPYEGESSLKQYESLEEDE